MEVDGKTLVFAAMLCLCVPMDWIAAALTAGIFHELCHLAMIRITGGRCTGIRIGSGGARMEMWTDSVGKELLCALAGPVGSLLLLGLGGILPKIAVCGLLQGIFNLLPVYPLDGGRVLRCILQWTAPIHGARIAAAVEWFFCGGLLLAGAWAGYRFRLGILPFLSGLMLICRAFLRKRPCKPWRIGLQ